MNEVRKKLMELTESEIAALYKTVFGTPEGALVLEDLKDRFFWYAPVPLGENGQRAIGMIDVIRTIERNKEYTPEDEIYKTVDDNVE